MPSPRPPRRDMPRHRLLMRDVARMRSRLFRRLLEPSGLTSSQAWVLAHLLWEDGLTQRELAVRLEIGAVAAGGLVDRLEAQGLVARHGDPADKRVRRVVLTDRAMPLLDAMTAAMLAVDRRSYEGLSPSELQALEGLLTRIHGNLSDALAEGSASDKDRAASSGASSERIHDAIEPR